MSYHRVGLFVLSKLDQQKQLILAVANVAQKREQTLPVEHVGEVQAPKASKTKTKGLI